MESEDSKEDAQSEKKSKELSYAEFSHKPGVKYYDFSEVRNEIL